jgi:acetyltransferase-like isoleucine patch superfamily enzyme
MKRIKVKHAFFLVKIIAYKIYYGRQLELTSWRVGLEKGAILTIAEGASIKLGSNVYIKRDSEIDARPGSRIIIGDNVFMNRRCTVVAMEEISVGDDSLLGVGVMVFDSNHKFDDPDPERLIIDQGVETKVVRIGRNCWIGSGAFVGLGASIGDNSVVAAHTVLVKPVPNNCVVRSKHELAIKSRQV